MSMTQNSIIKRQKEIHRENDLLIFSNELQRIFF